MELIIWAFVLRAVHAFMRGYYQGMGAHHENYEQEESTEE